MPYYYTVVHFQAFSARKTESSASVQFAVNAQNPALFWALTRRDWCTALFRDVSLQHELPLPPRYAQRYPESVSCPLWTVY